MSVIGAAFLIPSTPVRPFLRHSRSPDVSSLRPVHRRRPVSKVIRACSQGITPSRPTGDSTQSDTTNLSASSRQGSDSSSSSSALSFLQVVPNVRDNASLLSLALVGSLWTVSNLMVVSILPIYMKDVLGLSSTKIGAVEGAAIATAFLSKMVSGIASDLLRSRVAVILVGASMTLLAKPAFALAGGVHVAYGAAACFNFIVAIKVFDRLSKGFRAAPTDALLADLSPGSSRNRAYSLMHTAATAGGVVGSLICTACMLVTGNSYRATFLLASIPPGIAILLLLFAVKPPQRGLETASAGPPPSIPVSVSDVPAKRERAKADWSWGSAFRLSPRFYASATVISLLYMARFSESFVILRARSVGCLLSMIPLLATANQIVQATLTYPMGVLADKFDSRLILVVGWMFIIAAHCVFLAIPTVWGSVLGFILVAIHMSMTQANTKSLLSQTLEPHQRGTGFAVFSVMSGVALGTGNILAGYCNDIAQQKGMGLVGCFYSGAFFSSLSLALLLLYMVVFGRNNNSSKMKSAPQ